MKNTIKKCKFGVTEVDFLGLVLQPGEIVMDPTKLSGIVDWLAPTKVKDIRSFLGFANYYQWFIRDYSNIACPLINLTKKNQEWKWTHSCQKAFDRLKEEFSKQPVPPWPKQTICHCNWCLQRCFWRSPPPSRLKWRMAPLLLPLPITSPCRMKLWHLRLRTPHSHLRIKKIEALPLRILVPSQGLYRP